MNISMESLFSVGGQGIRAEVVVRGIVREFDGMAQQDEVGVAPMSYCSNSSVLPTHYNFTLSLQPSPFILVFTAPLCRIHM